LLEPAGHEGALAAVERAGPAGRCLGLQAVTAVLAVARFPTALGGHGMTKGHSDLTLCRQLTLAQHHRHEGQVVRIIQSHPIENLMTAEEDAIASAIVEPQTRINMRALVAGVGFGVREERGSIHTIIDAG
jgi:hypothetical protein